MPPVLVLTNSWARNPSRVQTADSSGGAGNAGLSFSGSHCFSGPRPLSGTDGCSNPELPVTHPTPRAMEGKGLPIPVPSGRERHLSTSSASPRRGCPPSRQAAETAANPPAGRNQRRLSLRFPSRSRLWTSEQSQHMGGGPAGLTPASEPLRSSRAEGTSERGIFQPQRTGRGKSTRWRVRKTWV